MVKRGLVLGGGGSKGAYEIGVWQACRELGLEFAVITGTSIGALNGALMIQGDFDKAKAMWEAMRYESVLSNVSEEELGTLSGARKAFRTALSEMVLGGGMDIAPLEKLVESMLDEDLVRRSSIAFGMVTVEFPSLRAKEMTKEDIPQGEMADYLLASCACYPAFKPREIGENRFVDGGYKDNLPINLAVDLGAREIIAVDLQAIGVVPKNKVYDVPVRYIRSYWDLGIFLTFDPQRISRNIWIGYLDTLRSFGRLEGHAYAFLQGSTQAVYERYQEQGATLLHKLELQVFEKPTTPFATLAGRRLAATLERGHRRKNNYPEYFQRAGELAGELLGVEPGKIYSWQEFHQELLHSFHQEENFSYTEVEEGLRDGVQDTKKVMALAKEFGKMETLHLLTLFYHWIAGADETGGKNLQLAAAVMPKEFSAAFYLYLISRSPV